MVRSTGDVRAYTFLLGAGVALLAGVAIAQQSPVGAMFADDQKRGSAIKESFATGELAPTAAAKFATRIYLTGGNLERAFDNPQFRPDAAIVPTNTDLMLDAQSPATQQVLVARVRKQTAVMGDLQDQIAARRKQPSSPQNSGGVLGIGVDSFVAELPRTGSAPADGSFPKSVCLIATDFAKGGAIDRRELFAQDRVRKGVAGCLTALDAAGARSLVLPLMGAASSGTQTKDDAFQGQRVLKECRLMNSLAGIALGIHDFAPQRRNIREIGIIQWDQELAEMFDMPKPSSLAQTAYRQYAAQIKVAFQRGLAGQKTTSSDIDVSCNAIFNPQ